MSGTRANDHRGSTVISHRGFRRQNDITPRITPRPYPATGSIASPIRRPVFIVESILAASASSCHVSFPSALASVFQSRWSQVTSAVETKRSVALLIIDSLSLENVLHPFFNPGRPRFGLFGSREMKQVGSLPPRRQCSKSLFQGGEFI